MTRKVKNRVKIFSLSGLTAVGSFLVILLTVIEKTGNIVQAISVSSSPTVIKHYIPDQYYEVGRDTIKQAGVASD